jgi:TMEM175 potassium channel family protein
VGDLSAVTAPHAEPWQSGSAVLLSMSTVYNRIAGRSLDRLAALSDGIFAVAMTLLVLDVRVPAETVAHVHSERQLWHALAALAPQLVAYLLSFTMLGTFWLGQQTHLNHFVGVDRQLAWIHLGFLAGVTLLPFSTSLLAQFTTMRTAIGWYWLNLLLLGLMLAASIGYAGRAGLLKAETTTEERRALRQRIVLAQVLYGCAALLCLVHPYVSVGALIVVQAYFVFSPSIRLRRTRNADRS